MKNNKGITMISLTIMIIVLFMLTGIVALNATKQLEIKNLNKLYADIETISSKVSEYYLKNGELPIYNDKYINDKEDFKALIGSENVNVNDGDDYYVINLSKLDNLTLNYGYEYKNWTSSSKPEDNDVQDIYVINPITHQIYYPYGVEIDDDVYFTTYPDDKIINKTEAYKVQNIPNNWTITISNSSKIDIDNNNVSILADVTISNLTTNDYYYNDLNSFEYAWTANNTTENLGSANFTKFKPNPINNGSTTVRLSSRAINKSVGSVYLCIGIMDKNGDFKYKFIENPINVSN